MVEITIRRYSVADKDLWDNFVNTSRNGNFLFLRGYMDYHADRFPDCSFLFFKGNLLVCVIPGTLSSKGIFSSHAGLTFGGFIVAESVGVLDVEKFFLLLDESLKKIGANKVVYKHIPWIFSLRPSDEDLYWLFRKKARLSARLISSTLEPSKDKPSSKKMYYLRKGAKNGLEFKESLDFEAFWNLLDCCLEEAHSAHPVHSSFELRLLAERFPNNIKLLIVTKNGNLLAGSIVYISHNVAHSQYLASSQEGRALHAMDFLMLNEISMFPKQIWFDWGTSCEEQGQVLNEGLVLQKESYAGRGVAFDTYEYEL